MWCCLVSVVSLSRDKATQTLRRGVASMWSSSGDVVLHRCGRRLVMWSCLSVTFFRFILRASVYDGLFVHYYFTHAHCIVSCSVALCLVSCCDNLFRHGTVRRSLILICDTRLSCAVLSCLACNLTMRDAMVSPPICFHLVSSHLMRAVR